MATQIKKDPLLETDYIGQSHSSGGNQLNINAFLDANIQYIKYGIYGVGLTGLLVLVKYTHAAKVFRSVSDVPRRFIAGHVTIRGVVENVNADSSLMMRHKPILSLPWHWFSEDKYFPVHIGGIKATPAGRVWLIQNLKGKPINITLLELTDRNLQLDGIINVTKNGRNQMVINEELISKGLCAVDHHFTSVDKYNNLLEKLTVMEDKATKKREAITNPGLIRLTLMSTKAALLQMIAFPGNVSNYFNEWSEFIAKWKQYFKNL